MATYATASQLIEHLGDEIAGQLADAAGGVLADETQLTTILTRASGEMDTYLVQQLTLPITPSDSFAAWLEQLALDIATYRLFVLRRLGDVEDARRRYDDALAWLKSFAAGTLEAQPEAAPDPDDPDPGSPDYDARDRVFTDDLLSKF